MSKKKVKGTEETIEIQLVEEDGGRLWVELPCSHCEEQNYYDAETLLEFLAKSLFKVSASELLAGIEAQVKCQVSPNNLAKKFGVV